jgi:hypothetical protein
LDPRADKEVVDPPQMRPGVFSWEMITSPSVSFHRKPWNPRFRTDGSGGPPPVPVNQGKAGALGSAVGWLIDTDIAILRGALRGAESFVNGAVDNAAHYLTNPDELVKFALHREQFFADIAVNTIRGQGVWLGQTTAKIAGKLGDGDFIGTAGELGEAATVVLIGVVTGRAAGGANVASRVGGGARYVPKGIDGTPLRLPRGSNGKLAPSSMDPHTQIGWQEGRRGGYVQTREFGANGQPVKQVDWTDHGRPVQHANPHVHDYLPNLTGGTAQHGPARAPRPGEL